MNPRPFLGVVAIALAVAGTLPAQDLYSASVGDSSRLLISLKLRNAQASTTFSVSAPSTAAIAVTAPASVTTDVSGYAALVVEARAQQQTSPPQRITVSLAGPGSPSKDFLLECRGGQVTSAWPDVLQIEGAFCNPPDSASTQLEISRATDLDGDGVYGDLIVEGATTGFDQIDFPSEFSMDINTTGSNGCIGGVAPGVFRPGAPTRPNVAFAADNRQVNGPCDFVSKMNFVEDMAFSASFGGSPALLFTSRSADVVYIGRDANGDGSLTDAEMPVFFDPGLVVNSENYSPDGIAVDPTGTRRAYWISDKSGAMGSPTNQGLFRLTDGNGDDRIGAGEWVGSWIGSTPTVMVEGQAVDPTEFEGLHVDETGAVLVNQVELGTVFRWVDGNQNGIAETGEVANWLTYDTASSLTVSQDFQQAAFPSFPGPFFPMNFIASVGGVAGSGLVWFVGSDDFAGATKGFVFRCEDGNGDGDVNDLGEVTIFSDPSQVNDPNPPQPTTGMDAIGIDANGNSILEDSELFVYGAFASGGPVPNCGFPFPDLASWRFHDANGDGDASDSGEYERVSIHPTGAFNRGLIVIPGHLAGGFGHTFYTRSAFVTVQPAACTSSAGRYLEIDYLRDKIEEGTQGTPFAGNQRFVLVTRGSPSVGFPSAGVAMAGAPAMPPLPLFSCSLGLLPPIVVDLIPAVTPSPQGEAQFALPLPPGVFGTVFFQAFSLDTPSVVLGEVAEVRLR